MCESVPFPPYASSFKYSGLLIKYILSYLLNCVSKFYDADTAGRAPSRIEPGGTMETSEAAAVSESEPPDSITWEGLEEVRVFSLFNCFHSVS